MTILDTQVARLEDFKRHVSEQEAEIAESLNLELEDSITRLDSCLCCSHHAAGLREGGLRLETVNGFICASCVEEQDEQGMSPEDLDSEWNGEQDEETWKMRMEPFLEEALRKLTAVSTQEAWCLYHAAWVEKMDALTGYPQKDIEDLFQKHCEDSKC